MRKLVKRILSAVCTRLCLRRVQSHGTGTHVNFPCKFTTHTIIGNNCHFNGITVTGFGTVRFGDNFHSARNIRVMTSYHHYEHGTALPYDETMITRDVTIGDNVWVGEGVMILAGAHIGEGAIIQAGSVVIGEIPPCAIAGGHPAKPFKYRDQAHYDRLKQEGRFYLGS